MITPYFVIIPLAAAFLIPLVSKRKAGLAVLFSLASTTALLVLSGYAFFCRSGETLVYRMSGWKLPVGVCRSPMHAAGLLLLGDAAGLVDPFTGEGIGNALYSARYAVETAVAARQAADYSARFLGRYADRLTEVLGPELRTSARLHWLSRHRRLINLVIHKAARNPQVRALIGDMLASAVPRRRLTNPLFYLNLLFK